MILYCSVVNVRVYVVRKYRMRYHDRCMQYKMPVFLIATVYVARIRSLRFTVINYILSLDVKLVSTTIQTYYKALIPPLNIDNHPVVDHIHYYKQ